MRSTLSFRPSSFYRLILNLHLKANQNETNFPKIQYNRIKLKIIHQENPPLIPESVTKISPSVIITLTISSLFSFLFYFRFYFYKKKKQHILPVLFTFLSYLFFFLLLLPLHHTASNQTSKKIHIFQVQVRAFSAMLTIRATRLGILVC